MNSQKTDPISLFQLAQSAHQSGQLQNAETFYLQLLRVQPQHHPAQHLLGMLLAQQSRWPQALAHLQAACELAPERADYWSNLGEARRRAGDLQGAQQALERAVQQNPQFLPAAYNLGMVKTHLQDFDGAIALYRQILKQAPQEGKAYGSLAALLLSQQEVDAAWEYLQQALNLGQRTAQNLTNLGLVYRLRGQADRARAQFQEALQVHPSFSSALRNWAELEEEQGRPEAASEVYRRILELTPQLAKAWLGLAQNQQIVRTNIGVGMDILMQGLNVIPQDPDLLYGMAIRFQQVKDVDEAIHYYEKALKADPEHLAALHGFAALMEKQGNLEQARPLYERLLHLRPESDLLRLHLDLMSPVILDSPEAAEAQEAHLHQVLDRWLGRELNFRWEDLGFYTNQANFMHTYQSRGSGRALREKCVQLFRPHLPRFEPQASAERNHIGFLITQGHEYIFMKSVVGLLNQFTRGKYRFTVFCNRLGYDHHIRPRLDNPEVEWVDLPLDIRAAAERVRNAGCDILNFWEISTDSQNFFLPFFKLAPVQTLSWGWPMTSGNPEVDYYLSSDDLETERGQDYYTEQLHRFSVLPTYYYRPPAPVQRQSRTELGLPEDKHLLFCSQTLLKLHPDYDATIAAILRADTEAQFYLLADKQPEINRALKARFERSCAGVSERIELVPRRPFADYLNLVGAMDLVLDSFHYVGANTSYDAFVMGVPVITLPSEHHRGRHTYGAYREMGIFEAVASDPEDYVSKVLHYAQNKAARNDLGVRILAACDVLFENPQIVREYEAFFDGVLAKL